MPSMSEYRCKHILTKQTDQVLSHHITIFEKLTHELGGKLIFPSEKITQLFSTLFPDFKKEIHTCFVQSKRLVCE